MLIRMSRRKMLAWVGIFTLSGMFLMGQDPWPSMPTISILSPASGELASSTDVEIDVSFSGDAGTFRAVVDDVDRTSELTVTSTHASGVITLSEEGSSILQCSVSNASGTAVARSVIHYSPTGYDQGLSSISEVQYSGILNSLPPLQSLHTDVDEFKTSLGYTSDSLSRLMFENQDFLIIVNSSYSEQAQSIDKMVHVVEMVLSPSIAQGPRYWAFVQEQLSPNSFIWYVPNSSAIFDYTDLENTTITYGSGPLMDSSLPPPHMAAFSCFFNSHNFMQWIACGSTLIGGPLCFLAPGFWKIPGCVAALGAIIVACGSCDLCTYPWCN